MFNYLLGKFVHWFLTTKFWKKMGKICAVTNIRPFGYLAFPIDDYFTIIDRLEPNQYYAFISTDSRTLSSLMIKLLVRTTHNQEGFFSHGGLVFLDGDRNTKAMHVNHAGFQYQSLLAHLKEVDYLAIVKIPVKSSSDETIQTRIEDLKNRAGQIKYDWEERLDNSVNEIYCTEMVYNVFKDVVDNSNFIPRQIANNYYFDPDVLLKVGEIIYCNHPKLAKY
jgi:hypothetical protein